MAPSVSTGGGGSNVAGEYLVELEVVKVLQGYAIEAVKIPLSGSVAGFAATSARC